MYKSSYNNTYLFYYQTSDKEIVIILVRRIILTFNGYDGCRICQLICMYIYPYTNMYNIQPYLYNFACIKYIVYTKYVQAVPKKCVIYAQHFILINI